MKPERLVSISFAVSAAASLALVVVYSTGGGRALEGILLGLGLGGLGTGIVVWATRLMDSPQAIEPREPLRTPPEERASLEGDEVTRRTLLVRMLVGAGAALAAALAIPTLSLGPAPGSSLWRTKWRRGLRLVDSDGTPIRPLHIPLDGVRTVFPEGHVGSADSQALVIRVAPGLLALEGERSEWTPESCVVYSKICTHAGCPVGLYRARAKELLCPCHQSTFDVLHGAVPVFGPAARPLPQLPVTLDEDGYLVALGDFTAPVGPSFWNLRREGPL